MPKVISIVQKVMVVAIVINLLALATYFSGNWAGKALADELIPQDTVHLTK